MADELDALADARSTHPEVRVAACVDAGPAEGGHGRGAPPADVVLPSDVDDDDFERAVLDLLVEPRSPRSLVSRSSTSRTTVARRDVPAVRPIRVGGEVLGPRTVSRLRPPPEAALPPRLVIVTSAKGGEGVSTVALNVANTIVHETGTRTAIVDGEPVFGDISFDAGAAVRPLPTVFELPIADAIADELVVRPPEPGPVIVSSPTVGGELAHRHDEVLRSVLALAGEHGDIVIADVPWDLLMASDLAEQAALVALVTTRRSASIKNAVVAARLIAPADNVGLIINETDRRRRTTSIEELVRIIGVPLLGHLPYSGALSRAATRLPPNEIAEAQTRYGRAMKKVLSAVVTHLPVLA
jgi:MinD-like ATPase involved in chromosome partitioning or flagellar assembly